MACATLKRSLDFDPVHGHGRPAKRQRCIPMCVSPSSSPPTTRNESCSPSPFSDICPKLTPGLYGVLYRECIVTVLVNTKPSHKDRAKTKH